MATFFRMSQSARPSAGWVGVRPSRHNGLGGRSQDVSLATDLGWWIRRDVNPPKSSPPRWSLISARGEEGYVFESISH